MHDEVACCTVMTRRCNQMLESSSFIFLSSTSSWPASCRQENLVLETPTSKHAKKIQPKQNWSCAALERWCTWPLPGLSPAHYHTCMHWRGGTPHWEESIDWVSLMMLSFPLPAALHFRMIHKFYILCTRKSTRPPIADGCAGPNLKMHWWEGHLYIIDQVTHTPKSWLRIPCCTNTHLLMVDMHACPNLDWVRHLLEWWFCHSLLPASKLHQTRSKGKHSAHHQLLKP